MKHRVSALSERPSVSTAHLEAPASIQNHLEGSKRLNLMFIRLPEGLENGPKGPEIGPKGPEIAKKCFLNVVFVKG